MTSAYQQLTQILARDGKTSDTPRGLAFTDLPENIIGEIALRSANDDVITLASTCQRLNKVVASHIFSHCGLEVEVPHAILTVSKYGWGTPERHHVLPHLLSISLWIQSVQAIYCTFHPPFAHATRSVGHLASLIARLPESTLEEATFDFSPFASKKGMGTSAMPLTTTKWEIALTTLIQTTARKGVKNLRVLGGSQLPDFLYNYRPEQAEAPAPGGQPGAPLASFSQPSSSDQPRLEGQRSFFSGLFAALRQRGPMQSTPPTDSTTTQQSTSRPPDFCNLQTLHFDCPVLFLPPFLQWSIRFITLHSENISCLSLSGHDLDPTVWEKVLNTLNLPNLTNFTIQSGLFVETEGAKIDVLLDFFDRHHTITHLRMHGMHLGCYPLPYSTQRPTPILPHLTHISAHPWYIATILNSHTQAGMDPLQCFRSSISSIGILGASYKPHDSRKDTQPNDIQPALEALFHSTTPKIALSLIFSFAHVGTYEDWIQAQVDSESDAPPGDQSRCTEPAAAAMDKVWSMTLDCGHAARFTHTQLVSTLPAFFNLFASLEEVHCWDYAILGPSSEELTAIWREKCPRVRRFDVRGVFGPYKAAQQVQVEPEETFQSTVQSIPSPVNKISKLA